MCGRYASARKTSELLEEFGIQQDATEQPVEPDYNIAPTKNVPAVLTRRPRKSADGEGGSGGRTGAADTADGADAVDDAEPVRQLRLVRWGLVPSWAKDRSIGNRLINARIETVHEKPAFRRAFARRRCLLPADGYYEWYVPESEAGKKRPRKQPFFIRPDDGGVLAMAGLYELWRDPSVPDGEPGAWLWTATVITTEAEDDVGHIHDRMPMLVERDSWAAWLDPDRTDPEEVRTLLVPATPSLAGTGRPGPGGDGAGAPGTGRKTRRRLAAYPVSTAVNRVTNNGPELINPLPAEELSGDDASTLF